MVQVPRRTGFSGSTLVGLLARLTDIDVADAKRAFADRLSQWLGWTDAITLSSVLNGDGAMVSTARTAATRSRASSAAGSTEEAECARVRAVLVAAINGDLTPARNAATGTTTEFAPYRRRYVARQQAMETNIAGLRKRVRVALARKSPAMAQLAALDTVMEQALAAQEQRLLASVPGMLEKYFKRLAHGEPGAWQDTFAKDMRSVLLAELEIRLQPVEGLLEALRET
ncbi:DUF3348 domain-containing protein [soil metagenome]